jgi:large subunit ribosomal protein L44
MLTRRPTEQLSVPTSTFASGVGDVFELGEASNVEYQAPELVMSELMFESSGKRQKTPAAISSLVPNHGI